MIKYLLFFAFILLSAITLGQFNGRIAPVQDHLTIQQTEPQRSNEIKRFEKLELRFTLPSFIQAELIHFFDQRGELNPYDSDQIILKGAFQHDSLAKPLKINGFFKQEIQRDLHQNKWIRSAQSGSFNVRFSPPYIGKWTVEFQLIVKGHPRPFRVNYQFNCLPSTNPGYLQFGKNGNTSDRYLRFSSSKDAFFAIGENMSFPNYEALKPTSNALMMDWMDDFASQGGNYIRVWMNPHGYGIEQDHVLNYQDRQPHAWELDQIFEKAEELGIYIQLLIVGNAFSPSDSWPSVSQWDNNPYKKEFNLTETKEFYQNKNAIEALKKRVHYISSRWGYSTNLACYEWITEPDNGSNYNNSNTDQLAFINWVNSLDNYLKDSLSDQSPQLTLLSFQAGGANYRKEMWENCSVDISSVNNYTRHKENNYLHRYRVATKMLEINQGKAFIFSELGLGVGHGMETCSDLPIHNAIWSSSFFGSYGNGLYWWWMEATHKTDNYKQFLPLSEFFKSEFDLIKTPYSASKWTNGFGHSNGTLELFTLTSQPKNRMIGWVHNSNYYWKNLKDSIPCVQDAIDGKFKPKDPTNWAYKVPENTKIPETTIGSKFLLKGLSPNTNYTIRFYDTWGKGNEIQSLKLNFKTNILGRARIPFPSNNGNSAYDYAFKVKTLVIE